MKTIYDEKQRNYSLLKFFIVFVVRFYQIETEIICHIYQQLSKFLDN